MDNSININFGIRPKRAFNSPVTKRTIGGKVIESVKKMYPKDQCPDGIIGVTRIGDTVVKVSINPSNYVIDVEPHNMTEEALKRLDLIFSKGKKLRHKHSKPRPDHAKVRNRHDKYDRNQYKRLNIEF